MKALQYNRRSTEKLVLKGIVDALDCSLINYNDEEGIPHSLDIDDVLRRFSGENVSITVALNTDEDLLEEGQLPTVEPAPTDGGNENDGE